MSLDSADYRTDCLLELSFWARNANCDIVPLEYLLFNTSLSLIVLLPSLISQPAFRGECRVDVPLEIPCNDSCVICAR